MVLKNFDRKKRFLAWTVSIIAHLFIFSLLAAIDIHPSPAEASQNKKHDLLIQHIKSSLDTSFVISKPKFNQTSNNLYSNSNDKKLNHAQIFPNQSKIVSQKDIFKKPQKNNSLFSSKPILPGKIKFYDSVSDARKICYLVDSSGSMHGLLSSVKQELRTSISALRPDNYFALIFFGNDQLYQFQEGKMVRATKSSISSVLRFIDRIEPQGPTNAIDALSRAINVKDSINDPPQVIYFLTDGFEFRNNSQSDIESRITSLLRKNTSTINTIAFWPQEKDKKILRLIADLSGGTFTCYDK